MKCVFSGVSCAVRFIPNIDKVEFLQTCKRLCDAAFRPSNSHALTPAKVYVQ